MLFYLLRKKKILGSFSPARYSSCLDKVRGVKAFWKVVAGANINIILFALGCTLFQIGNRELFLLIIRATCMVVPLELVDIFSDVHMFSHVNVQPINDGIKAFASQSESCIVYFQIAFRIWRLYSQRLLQIFLRRRRKAIDLFQLVAVQNCLYGIKKTRTHRANRRVMSHCSKNFSFKERAERD